MGETTVKKALKELDYHVCASRVKPWLDKRMENIRVVWCRERNLWTLEIWRRMVWCDEVKIEAGAGGLHDYVRRKPNTAFEKRNLRPSFHSGRIVTQFWACFTYGHRGPIVFIRQRPPEERTGPRDHGGLNQTQYRDEVLEPHFLPFWNEVTKGQEGFIFIQDRNGPHIGGKVKAWLTSHGIEVSAWPGNSADLNPIENAWVPLKQGIKIRTRDSFKRPRTQKELIKAVEEEWAAIPQSFFDKLADSMPRRIEAVLKAKGGPTKY